MTVEQELKQRKEEKGKMGLKIAKVLMDFIESDEEAADLLMVTIEKLGKEVNTYMELENNYVKKV